MQLSEWLGKQREWSLRVFGPGRRTLGLVSHIRKELAEIEADPTDPMEWVDVFILAMDGAHRTDCSLPYIVDRFEKIHSVLDVDLENWLSGMSQFANSEIYPTVKDWCIVARLAVEELWQMNYDKDEIFAMLEAKQLVNFARQWPAWQDQDKATEHVRGRE